MAASSGSAVSAKAGSFNRRSISAWTRRPASLGPHSVYGHGIDEPRLTAGRMDSSSNHRSRCGKSLKCCPCHSRRRCNTRRRCAEQAQTLEILGETILPGCAAAGLVHFIDHQLGVDPNDALLIAKYFRVAPPYGDFYTAGARIADAMARKSAGKSIEKLDAAQMQSLVKAMAVPGTVVDGFSIFVFYMCLRSDAVDVNYVRTRTFCEIDRRQGPRAAVRSKLVRGLVMRSGRRE
jgi:hypothetical protein